MRYKVLKEFHDDDFRVRSADGKKVPIAKEVGEVFIPAEVNYPANKIGALVVGGTLKLIVPEPTKAEKAAKK